MSHGFCAAAAAARSGLDETEAVAQARPPAYAHLPRYEEWLPVAVRKLYREARAGENGGRR